MKYNILATAFSFLLIGLALFTPADVAFAERLVPCDGPDCNLCQLAQLAENIINFIVRIAFVAAALLFAAAGFMFFTGGADPTKITNARKIFTNTFVGIIIILTSWLVVNVLLTTLMGEGINPFTDRVFCAEVQTRTQTNEFQDAQAGTATLEADGVGSGLPPGGKSTEQMEREFRERREFVRSQEELREILRESEKTGVPTEIEIFFYTIGNEDSAFLYTSIEKCNTDSLEVGGTYCRKKQP